MRSRKGRGTAAGAVLALLVAAWAAPAVRATALDVKASGTKTFYVDERAGANQVVITSESTIEDFTSVANAVTGQFQLDPKNLEGVKGKFSIRVVDIRTGIDLRDRDLQGPDWLDAAKFPLITITIQGAKDVQKKSANSASLTAVGTCTMHGVTHDVSIAATVVYLDESPITQQRAGGDLIAVRANLSFKLSDYKITGPTSSEKAIGLKVADVQPVRVSVFASSEPPPPPLAGPGGLAPAGRTGGGPASQPAAQPAAPSTPALPLPPRPSGQ